MRPFEWLLAILTLAATLTLFLRPRPAALAWLFCLLALTAFTLHALREGTHWQLYPLYLAVLLTVALLARPSSPWLALAPLSLTAASLALAWALPIFHLPAPTGPYAVGTRTLHLTDPNRHRPLVAQLWYPAQPTGPLAPYLNPAEIKPRFRYLSLVRTNARQDAPIAAQAPRLPILLFGPMWGGRRTQYTFLAEDLASHGYLVAVIDHPGNAALLQLPSGAVLPGTLATALQDLHTPAAITALWNHELTVWLADNRFVLTTLLADPSLAPRIDPTRIGALGHSFGGAAALNLLGQDPRVLSALNLDGWTFAGLTTRTTQPALLLYSAAPAAEDPIPETLPTAPDQDSQLERADRILVDANLAQHGGLKAYVQGSQHMDFTDQTLLSPLQRLTHTGPVPGPRMRQLTRTLVLSFFDQTLKARNPNPTLPNYPELRHTR